jgi:hypothetical protein
MQFNEVLEVIRRQTIDFGTELCNVKPNLGAMTYKLRNSAKSRKSCSIRGLMVRGMIHAGIRSSVLTVEARGCLR